MQTEKVKCTIHIAVNTGIQPLLSARNREEYPLTCLHLLCRTLIFNDELTQEYV